MHRFLKYFKGWIRMRGFLQRCIRQTFLPMLLISLAYPASVLAEMVSCPASLTWYFSGYCARKMLPNEGKCPAPSRMEKKSVAGEALCISEGRCLGGGTPDAKGVCIEVTTKLEQNRSFKQKDKL
jgi:hypothetical protein